MKIINIEEIYKDKIYKVRLHYKKRKSIFTITTKYFKDHFSSDYFNCDLCPFYNSGGHGYRNCYFENGSGRCSIIFSLKQYPINRELARSLFKHEKDNRS